VTSRAREAWGGGFYSPLRESNRWDVRNPNMSGSRAGHVRPTSLETGLGTVYVRSGTYLLRNWVRSDMSELGPGHVQEMPLESNVEAGYAWLTRDKAERPDMSDLGAGHVWPESLESGYGAGYVWSDRSF
jgi:hypothetical protein